MHSAIQVEHKPAISLLLKSSTNSARSSTDFLTERVARSLTGFSTCGYGIRRRAFPNAAAYLRPCTDTSAGRRQISAESSPRTGPCCRRLPNGKMRDRTFRFPWRERTFAAAPIVSAIGQISLRRCGTLPWQRRLFRMSKTTTMETVDGRKSVWPMLIAIAVPVFGVRAMLLVDHGLWIGVSRPARSPL
jgi:hypothetical protein